MPGMLWGSPDPEADARVCVID